MESTYVTTCFGLRLWPSSGYNLVALMMIQGEDGTFSGFLKSNRHMPVKDTLG